MIIKAPFQVALSLNNAGECNTCASHWRIQEFEKGGIWRARSASLQWGLGALPPVGPRGEATD